MKFGQILGTFLSVPRPIVSHPADRISQSLRIPSRLRAITGDIMRRWTLIGLIGLCTMSLANAEEIGFLEDFVLAKDRAAVLKQLVPGTDDHSYFHGLHYIQTQQFEKLEPLLTAWAQRSGETPRLLEIKTRYALATYDRNPQKTLEFLRNRFGLTFAHERITRQSDPDLPTSLDPNLISRSSFLKRANAITTDNVEQFEASSYDWLINSELTAAQRRSLLSVLSRPDHDKLLKLIIDDLNADRSSGFGSLPIHSRLLITQLEELVKAKPDLLNQQAFVNTYLTKLHPTEDEDWRNDHKLLEAYLDRLLKFVNRLSPSHNSLKAHVLYHRLLLDRARDDFSKERLIEYLKLPRNVFYISKKLNESDAFRRFPSDLNANFQQLTALIPIGNDEPLIRSYLGHFLVDATSTKDFEPYINDQYLKQLLAEVKILNGLGDVDQWAAQLPPDQLRQLKERVDIDFVFSNKTRYAADENVKLDLYLKNTGTLIVKIFEINATNFYREKRNEITTDIMLDGLVANVENTFEIQEPPLRRIRKTFEFPQINKPGTYVIDFIGNGFSSRAVVRKGFLRHFARSTSLGQVVTVFDEKNAPVTDATIWLDGHEYRATQNGKIVVPFSASNSSDKIIISRGSVVSLNPWSQGSEEYKFGSRFYVDRESLLTRKTAKLLIRPVLTLNGGRVSVSKLEDVKLTLLSTDRDGIASSKEIPGIKLVDDRDTVYEFEVPARLASLKAVLSAQIQVQSKGNEKQSVESESSFSLNNIDRTDKIEAMFLVKTADNYALELRGKTGEPKPSRPVQLSLKHRDFTAVFPVTLKTDADGRIQLGSLADIALVQATGPEAVPQRWKIDNADNDYAQVIQAKVGETVFVPVSRKSGVALDAPATRDEISLLEFRHDSFVNDRFSHITMKDGFAAISKLPPGEYNLLLKPSETEILIRITDGSLIDGFAVKHHRQLEISRPNPLQISSVAKSAGGVSIKVRNASKFSRVHVIATNFVPEYDIFKKLQINPIVQPQYRTYGVPGSEFLTGRNIGDEYRYIIDRKYAKKYPGVMLDRPALLLNPWEVRTTETTEQLAQAGHDGTVVGLGMGMGGASAGRANVGVSTPPQRPKGARDDSADAAEKAFSFGTSKPELTNFPNFDFLGVPSLVLDNLIPNEEGVIEIAADALGNHQHIHVIAEDPYHTVYRSLSLPDRKPLYRDLRLTAGLDPKGQLIQHKEISLVQNGEAIAINDITSSRFEFYDSLAKVYSLYSTLNHDPKLAEFAFVLNWPKLSKEEKRSQYSKYASHELSFFLSKKDPEFFQQVIKPYLANKKDKTFIDRYLLDEDLSVYRTPWRFGQLNVAERALLAQHLVDERANTIRHLDDLVTMLPPNTDRFIKLFDTAVKQSALNTEDLLGIKEQLDSKQQQTPLPAQAAPNLRFHATEEDMKDANKKLSESKKRMKAGKDIQPDDANVQSNESDFFYSAADLDMSGEEIRQLYRKLDKAKEWAENNYYQLPIDQQTPELITINAFWADFAKRDASKPFLSRNVAEPTKNASEMLLALAVLDLPFESPKHDVKFDGTKMVVGTAGPMIVFHEEIKKAQMSSNASKVLVTQNFFRHGDRTKIENGETVDKYITDEFVTQTVYVSQVVVTNPSSNRQKLDILIQIPIGAIPVQLGQATKTTHITLEPYHTQTIDTYFYFPYAGQFTQFPVQVSKNEVLIESTAPPLLKVVDQPTETDQNTWQYVSQEGSLDEVLKFLDTHNVVELNLDLIAWRMRDADAFNKIVAVLTQRHVYNGVIWAYAIKHNVPTAIREYLQHDDGFVQQIGGRLNSPLLVIDPVVRRTYEHLEYKPLVNARAHSLGKRRQIMNKQLHEQYHKTLHQLSYERELKDDDLLSLAYYMLLQDRIDDAVAAFNRVNVDKITTTMQYDYCAAYLDFFTDEPKKAKSIAMKYVDHPVDRWRQTFASISAQLDEAAGGDNKPVDQRNRDQQQALLASTEPNFDLSIEGKQIRIDSQNLKTVRVNFYEIDLELLFSRNPFLQDFQGSFSFINPNKSIDVTVGGDDVTNGNESQKNVTKMISLPPELQNRNILVEVVGAGQTKAKPYYSHSLNVQVIENYGQLKVTHQETGKPIAKTYVKVFAQMADGNVRFFKDGYTDLRGRFDYSSLNSNSLDTAAKFSILVMSDTDGSLVRDARPPKQ